MKCRVGGKRGGDAWDKGYIDSELWEKRGWESK
jgi:hypothetical protein